MTRGRPREFDREEALQNAMLAFWRKGYYATTIPDLCTALGVKPPSLYAAFGSKEKLYVEAIELYMKGSQLKLWSHLEGKSARTSIENMLLATATELTNIQQHPIGCWITLSMVDEDMPVPVMFAIRKARKDWLDVVRSRLKSAVEDGELPAATDVDSLSRFYVGIAQSIGVQTHDGASKVEMENLAKLAMNAWPSNTD